MKHFLAPIPTIEEPGLFEGLDLSKGVVDPVYNYACIYIYHIPPALEQYDNEEICRAASKHLSGLNLTFSAGADCSCRSWGACFPGLMWVFVTLTWWWPRHQNSSAVFTVCPHCSMCEVRGCHVLHRCPSTVMAFQQLALPFCLYIV